MLEIEARSAMLGYLNAASPFTADGWFKTGDAVEVDGETSGYWGGNRSSSTSGARSLSGRGGERAAGEEAWKTSR